MDMMNGKNMHHNTTTHSEGFPSLDALNVLTPHHAAMMTITTPAFASEGRAAAIPTRRVEHHHFVRSVVHSRL
jgi:hypothetical protein